MIKEICKSKNVNCYKNVRQMEGIFLQLKIPSSGYTPGWPPGDAL